MDDYRVKVGWRTHPKRVKLQRRLGADAVLAVPDLWEFCASSRTDGDLSGMSDEDIAIAAGYPGDAAPWVSALLEIGLLVGKPGRLRIHGWEEHNPYVASHSKRVAKSKAANDAKRGKRGPKDEVRFPPKATEGTSAGSEDTSTHEVGDLGSPDGSPPSPVPFPDPLPVPLPIPGEREVAAGAAPSSSVRFTETLLGVAPPPKGKAKPSEERIERVRPIAFRVLAWLSSRNGVPYETGREDTLRIARLLDDGYSVSDMRKVIAYCAEPKGSGGKGWAGDPAMADFLRPKTLFGPNNFADYVAPARAWYRDRHGDKALDELEMPPPRGAS
jgi:uncharacterized phage protein (TIGR02220 family)